VLRDRRFGTHPDDGTGAEASELSFVGMNPPDHTRLRRLAAPAFSPKAVASYTGRIESTVGALLDQAEAAGEFDLVSGFAAPLPIAVITDLLGVPDADSAAFARYGALIGTALGGIRSLRHASQLAASEAPLLQLFQIRSTSTATRWSATSRSPAASTTASGSRSRAWRRRRPCGCCPSGCRSCPWPARPDGAPASSSAVRSACRRGPAHRERSSPARLT
jgi:cytochrome P450